MYLYFLSNLIIVLINIIIFILILGKRLRTIRANINSTHLIKYFMIYNLNYYLLKCNINWYKVEYYNILQTVIRSKAG